MMKVSDKRLAEQLEAARVEARGVLGQLQVIVELRCLRAVFAGEVLFALHFDEAAGGALELKCDAVAAVELDGWGSG